MARNCNKIIFFFEKTTYVFIRCQYPLINYLFIQKELEDQEKIATERRQRKHASMPAPIREVMEFKVSYDLDYLGGISTG